MASNGWTVTPTKDGVRTAWRIDCDKCDPNSAPIQCRTSDTRARAWAENHHLIRPRTLSVSWRDCRPSAEWTYGAIADILLAGALQIPAVLGADTGHGFNAWATRIYGETETEDLASLQEAMRNEFGASQLTFRGADELTVAPLSERDYEIATKASMYRQYVAWRR